MAAGVEPIGGITVRHKIQLRDQFGRFAKILDAAAVATARELTDKAVELAKQHAPVKTGELRDSIEPRYAGKVGYVEVNAPHGHSIEKGAIRHKIPGPFGGQDGVMHPGNEAQPYLDPAGHELAAFAPGIVARNYPG